MVRLSNEVIEKFRDDYITSNNIGTTILILLALHKEDYDFLDRLDDSNKDKKMILLYRDLVYKGYLSENEDNEDSTNVHFSLTKKAIDMLDQLNDNEIQPSKVIHEEVAKEYIQKAKPITGSKTNEEIETVEEWITDWIKLFPVRGASSYPLRTGKGVCSNKMRIFLKNNDYTKQQIFDATKLYLKDQEKDGWRYTQIAGNFISKAESGRGNIRNSTLATYCELINTDEKPSLFEDLEDNNPFL